MTAESLTSVGALHVFDTAIGCCGIAWTELGVTGVQLPESSAIVTRARLRRRFPAAAESPPTPHVQSAIAGIVALLAGEETGGLTEIELDLRGVPQFNAAVYRVARTIPPGETLTYGQIAERLNDSGAARAVGQALSTNPIPIIIPCHRVLAAGNRAGGFSAPGGVTTKLKLLEIERRRLPFELT